MGELEKLESAVSLQPAKVSVTLLASDYSFLKENHELMVQKENRDGSVVGTMEVPVLLYHQSLLNQSGYVVVSLLGLLSKSLGCLHGIFGKFIDFGDLRGHIMLPCKYAVDYKIAVLDWSVLEWKMKKD